MTSPKSTTDLILSSGADYCRMENDDEDPQPRQSSRTLQTENGQQLQSSRRSLHTENGQQRQSSRRSGFNSEVGTGTQYRQNSRRSLHTENGTRIEQLSIEEITQLRQLLQLQSGGYQLFQHQYQQPTQFRHPNVPSAGADTAAAKANEKNATDYVDLQEQRSSVSNDDTSIATGSKNNDDDENNSQYDEFPESTHAWAIFADDPRQKTATRFDRAVGCFIIAFQLFTYFLFVKESIQDYQSGQVAVTTGHADCLAANQRPGNYFYGKNMNGDDDEILDESLFVCQAGFTNVWDAMVAFFMLAIFLAADFIQATRAILHAPTSAGLAFALLAGFEVSAAFIAAAVSVSYSLYIGEVTDAVEVGIGLLFVRELSARAYHGIRQKRNRMQNKLVCCGVRDKSSKIQQYRTFFATLTFLVVLGFIINPLCEYLFAAPLQY
ncbi:hypothetical protein ACA910_010579 [Epithemia clementina (nom. ined.)]